MEAGVPVAHWLFSSVPFLSRSTTFTSTSDGGHLPHLALIQCGFMERGVGEHLSPGKALPWWESSPDRAVHGVDNSAVICDSEEADVWVKFQKHVNGLQRQDNHPMLRSPHTSPCQLYCPAPTNLEDPGALPEPVQCSCACPLPLAGKRSTPPPRPQSS
jgi:hypothetical protein